MQALLRSGGVRHCALLSRASGAHGQVLAVLNVGRQLAPLDRPSIMAEFDAATPAVNALARTTPGFVLSFDNDNPAVRLTSQSWLRTTC